MRHLMLVVCLVMSSGAFAKDEEQRDLLILSSPEQIATLRMEQSELIGGVICPLSGQPTLRQTDLVAKGTQEIALERVYLPVQIPHSFPKHKNCQPEYDKKYLYDLIREQYKGWQVFPHHRLQWNPSLQRVRLSTPQGITADFQLSGGRNATLISTACGISNLLGEEVSGRHDMRNTQITYDPHKRIMTVISSEGVVRTYRYREKIEHYDLYLLEKEQLNNGRVLCYDYNESGKLSSVRSMDPQERNTYARLEFRGNPGSGKWQITSSSHTEAEYLYEKRTGSWKIKDQIKKGGKYELEAYVTSPPLLTVVNSPFFQGEQLTYEEQFLLDTHLSQTNDYRLELQAPSEEEGERRIHKVHLPVGANGTFFPVYELTYQPVIPQRQAGVTIVRHCDGSSTVYRISKEMLIESIQDFLPGGELKKEKQLIWGANQWIKSVALFDGRRQLLIQRSYEYDRFGNPIVETVSGDLTGEGNREDYTIRRTFSQEGKHLLLSELTEDGKGTYFSYLPGTDLLTRKIVKAGDQIVEREFFFYDELCNLIQKISDDGSGEAAEDLTDVSQRLYTDYVLRQEAPFLHQPEWIVHRYQEKEELCLLKKHHYFYDRYGNIAQEEIYDAHGELRLSLEKNYDARGKLISERNLQGDVASYAYDAHGRLIESTPFSQRRTSRYRYDLRGRLIEHKESGEEGSVHVSSTVYDEKDRIVQTRDLFDLTTSYRNDPVLGKPIEVVYPPMLSGDGQIIPVITRTVYDALGRKSIEWDGNGQSTQYRYNAYGSISEVIHPSGAREYYRYTRGGSLCQHTDREGVTTLIETDLFGRALRHLYLSKEGNELCQEQFTYKGSLLISETDREGHLTSYTYDGAGRKIREERCGRAVQWDYDALGQVARLCKYNQENTLVTHYQRDEAGRILEERKEDFAGNLLYQIQHTYDLDGNPTSHTRFINGQEAVEKFAYDSFGRLIEYTNPESHITRTSYDEYFTNLMGQRVLRKQTVDPSFVTILETFNSHHYPMRIDVLNAQGTVMASREMRQDGVGNLLYRRDQVCEKELFRDIQVFKYAYTPDYHLEAIVRAWGGNEPEETLYTYTPSGKVETKTLPDGVGLAYRYSPLGFLERLDSSDGQIHHAFEYNALGHLIRAVDENQQISIERVIDPFGNVIHESFPKGYAVSKTFDAFDRVLSLKMASQGEVLYSYDPLYLRAVTRVSNLRGVLYMHTYKDYDWDGNLVLESLIGNVGDVVHRTDLKGQIASISSPFYSQEYAYDASTKLSHTLLERPEYLQYYDRLPRLVEENHSDPFCLQKTDRTREALGMYDLYDLLSVDAQEHSYDLHKNQVVIQTPTETFCFHYDPLNRITEVSTETKRVVFSYDPLGRRLSKRVSTSKEDQWEETLQEYYLYHGQHEIGVFDQLDHLKNIRVLGMVEKREAPQPVCIELEGHIFAPLLDAFGNVRRLIDLNKKWKEIGRDYLKLEYGETDPDDTGLFNPWSFAKIRLDPELGPVYFAKKIYDSNMMVRWAAAHREE